MPLNYILRTVVSNNDPDSLVYDTGINGWYTPTGASRTFRFGFVGDSWSLDNGATFIPFGALPSGFRPTSATVMQAVGGPDNYTTPFDWYWQFDVATEGGHNVSSFVHPGPVPSAVVLWGDGAGLRFVNAGFYAQAGANPPQIQIAGTYVIDQWYYSPSADDYVLSDTDPGGDFEPVDFPTPRVDSIVPDHGPIAGGTTVTITGAGFYQPDGDPGVLRVLFDGDFEGTSINVISGKVLTCLTPAHWPKTVPTRVETDFEEGSS